MRAYEGYRVWNRGKASVVLDLDSEEGRRHLLDLIATADVLIESFRPGKMRELRPDYYSASPDLPALIYFSITPYGRVGEAADRPGIDLLVQARSGEQYEQPGWRDGPIFLPPPLPSIGHVVPGSRGRRRAVRPGGHRSRAVGGDTRCIRALWSSPPSCGRTSSIRPDLVRDRPRSPAGCVRMCGRSVGALDAQRGGRGKDQRTVWGILDIEPIQPMGPGRPRPGAGHDARRVSADPPPELLEEFWANDIRSRRLRPTRPSTTHRWSHGWRSTSSIRCTVA